MNVVSIGPRHMLLSFDARRIGVLSASTAKYPSEICSILVDVLHLNLS